MIGRLGILLVLLMCTTGMAQSLKVGDKAPGWPMGRWLKGEPVNQWESGKVYVLEFWATWCPPCRKSIPHINELQKKYPEVVFIGQNCMENRPAEAIKFVKEMGEKMDYRVVTDTNNRMVKLWMEPAGLNSIPCAFIIDKEGKIAWIGHPMAMEKPLQDTMDPAAATKPLQVGDPAPALMTGEWIKGEPVSEFDRGTAYVVEFWATWCGPCRSSIPHLSELQKKYSEIVFIGQNCWERDESAVEPFVAKMGDQMNYRVALDDREKMARHWMKAANQKGIPCAFVVDKDGKIAWIGHPMQLDKVLPRVQASKATSPKATTRPLGKASRNNDLRTR